MDILIFILQMRKLKLKKGIELAQSHISFKWHSQMKIWITINQLGMLKEMVEEEAIDR